MRKEESMSENEETVVEVVEVVQVESSHHEVVHAIAKTGVSAVAGMLFARLIEAGYDYGLKWFRSRPVRIKL
jgi:hypothetical protein